VTSIGYDAFYNCRSLTSITLPEGVTSIGNYAFYNCSSLTSITLPEGVTSIGSYTFYNCSSLTSITLPEGVTSIGEDAFRHCSSLMSITLPESLTSINQYAFCYCNKLKHIVMPGANVPSIGYGALPSKPTIYCHEFSEVDFWAAEKGYKVVYLDTLDTQTPIELNLPKDCKMEVGKMMQVTPILFPEIENAEIVWISSAPEIVSVDNGVLTALSIGQATITAQCGNVSDEMVITTVISVQSFELSDTEMWMVSKETAQLSILNKQPENTTSAFSYESSDTSILSVSSKGLITAKTPGDAVVTVTSDNGIQRTCTVHVCYPVTAIEFKDASVVMKPDETIQLIAMVTARTQNFENKLVTFTSSNENVVKVDENGVVTAVSFGTATITAASSNGISTQCTIEIPCENHIEVIDEAVAPTCIATGLTEGSHCSVCGKTLTAQEIVPMSGHAEVTDEAVAPTCTKTGLTEGKHCSVCSEVLAEQEIIPAKGHTEVVDASVESTCTETGLTEGKHCSVCNEVLVKQEEVAAKGHTEVIDAAIEATCTETGLTEGKHCSVCSEILIAQNEIPAFGHKEVVDNAIAATCTTVGKTEGKHCSVCSEVLVAQSEVPALGHKEVVDNAIAATCTTAGKTEGRHCSVCSEILVAQTEIPALGHKEITTPAVPATHKTTGWTEGKSCERCGLVIAEQTEIPVADVVKMHLPASLKAVKKYSFVNIAAECVIVPYGCERIEANAFSNNAFIRFVEIPASVEFIDDAAFAGCPEDMVIVTTEDSFAHGYAQENGILFVLVEKLS